MSTRPRRSTTARSRLRSASRGISSPTSSPRPGRSPGHDISARSSGRLAEAREPRRQRPVHARVRRRSGGSDRQPALVRAARQRARSRSPSSRKVERVDRWTAGEFDVLSVWNAAVTAPETKPSSSLSCTPDMSDSAATRRRSTMLSFAKPSRMRSMRERPWAGRQRARPHGRRDSARDARPLASGWGPTMTSRLLASCSRRPAI